MPEDITILKNPILSPGEDYAFLRKKGMEYIEALGSKLWTDYNIHDPGITLLELLCYAISDLGYRTSFDIKSLLAEPSDVKYDWNLQGFFTARKILTINPWTINDYRKLLVDIPGIKNAWLFVKECPCNDMFLYANCAKSVLQYSPNTEHQIIVKGFYDVLIEFENEDIAGDLNSGKIKYNFSFVSNSASLAYSIATLEMRLPAWNVLEEDKAKYEAVRKPSSQITEVKVKFISGNRGENADIPQNELARALRRPLYATVEIVFNPDSSDPSITDTLLFEDIPFSIWFKSDADRKALQLADLNLAMSDSTASGVFSKYLEKIKKADAAVSMALESLHEHRNLCEDYCSVKGISVEDIAICGDMDVNPDADIEQVLAQAYYLIGEYFSADIKFYSLQELLNEGRTVDAIFDGPALSNGFIDDTQLEKTQLKKVLHTSDIINLVMDIPGVIALRNLVLVRYDKEGNRVQSESWSLTVSYNHQPRLYIEGSKFLVFKNGLPFLPDNLELADTMEVIKGINVQPKYSVLDNDLPVPEGDYYQLNEYTPIQYSLPLTYGVGKDGLPAQAGNLRRAQAKQLKAYLIVFEQILSGYLEQLSKLKSIFALDTSISQTYFSRYFNHADIDGIADIYTQVEGEKLNQDLLNGLTENRGVFLDRRNRFLNHLLARFAEQFTDYALMLYSYQGNKKLADEVLIKDKVSFLKEFPFMSRNRAKAFNYKDPGHVCSNENIAGLQKRIERLLGFKGAESSFQLYEEHDADGVLFERRWRLVDAKGKIYISGSTRYMDEDFAIAQEKANMEIREVLKYIGTEASYEIKKEKKWVVNLKDPTGEVIATRKQSFGTEAAAKAVRGEIIAFAKEVISAEKIFIVEHILLRPRNKPGAEFPEGSPLLPICLNPNCEVCGEEDPYSFRLTIVLNGEAGLANAGIAYRRFAEDTIRKEVPAHLALKICWVSTSQLLSFESLYCAWLAELARRQPSSQFLHDKLIALLNEFNQLKSVYPKASLHDCVDGNDENRVYLNQTII